MNVNGDNNQLSTGKKITIIQQTHHYFKTQTSVGFNIQAIRGKKYESLSTGILNSKQSFSFVKIYP